MLVKSKIVNFMQIIPHSLKLWSYDTINKINLRPIYCFEFLFLNRKKKTNSESVHFNIKRQIINTAEISDTLKEK